MAQVTIYTRMMCGYCSLARRLLESKGVELVEHDASFSPELRREMIQRSGGRTTFPQIFIGERHIGGSDELRILEAQGQLDALLAEGKPA
jgi:glutaredoxin 3